MERPVGGAAGAADAPARRLVSPTPRVAVVIVAAVLLVTVMILAGGAARPFLLGALLVYLLAPAVDRLATVGIPRPLAVLVVFAVTLVAIGAVATLALSPLVAQVRLFLGDLPSIVATLRATVVDVYGGLALSPETRDAVDGLLAGAAAGAGAIDLAGVVSPLVTSLIAVVSTITAYAILPAWLFFLLKDRMRLADALERALPVDWRGDVFAIAAIVNRVFGNWIRGQLLLGAVVGLASYVGLTLLSFAVDPVFGRYAVLLAIAAGLLELVPFIGPIIAAVPAVLVGLTAGPAGFLAALLLYLVIQQLENNLLVPKIQGDAVELHPSVVMFALVMGAAIAGVLGAIVSLPIAAASRDIFRYTFHRVGEPPASVAASLARISPRLPSLVRSSALGASLPGVAPPDEVPVAAVDEVVPAADPTHGAEARPTAGRGAAG